MTTNIWWIMGGTSVSAHHLLWMQMHNNGAAQIYPDPSQRARMRPCCVPGVLCCTVLFLFKLTELSPGLLQLLDLVLQEEHGQCERQQRQQLQLGRHHDSEQPHQIIQRGMWSVHAQRRRH